MAGELIYSAGIVTAYGAAKRAGYTGTYDQFCRDQAGFAAAAQQVREDKESVEQTVQTFEETTFPEAVQSVEDEGTRQIGLVGNAGTAQIGGVNAAGSAAVGTVNQAGTTQVNAVNSAGTTQVGNVNSAGSTQVQAVEDKGEEVLESIPSDYTALSNKVNDPITGLDTKAPAIFDTTTGDIASFSDGADDMPMKALVATIEPVQDLHGFDHPWPAGSGKNKVRITHSVINAGEPFTVNGVTFTPVLNGTGSVLSITANDTASERTTVVLSNNISSQLPSGDYIVSGCPSGGGSGKFRITCWDNTASAVLANDYGQGASFTLDNTHSVNYAIDISSGVTVNNIVFQPMIRLSTVSDATFEPYSNICPITGWTGLSGKRTSGNLANVLYAEVGTGSTLVRDSSTGSLHFTNNASSRYAAISILYRGVLAANPFPKGEYTVSFDIAGTITTNWIAGTRSVSSNLYSGIERVTFSSAGHYSFTFDSSAWTEDCYISIGRIGNETSDIDVTISNLTIFPGAAEGTFEPYVAQDISVNWQTEAGTVYGGTVDVVSGKLTANYRYGHFGPAGSGSPFVMGGEPLTAYPNTYVYSNASIGNAIVPNEPAQITQAICSHLPSISRNQAGTGSSMVGIFQYHSEDNNNFRIAFPREEQFSTNEKLNGWLQSQITAGTPFAVCFPLKETIEYQLTPQEVTTLLGNNIVYTDVGPVSVTAPRDTKMYVDNKIAEAVAAALNA